MSGGVDTAVLRAQLRRRTEALRLVQRPGVRLVLLRDRRVRIDGDAPPELVAKVREVRAELCEFLEGHRCLACGGGLVGRDDVRVEGGGGFVHSRCPGRRG